MQDQKLCLHAIVEGRVQGVGFRYFVADYALALGVTGWVRNRFSGDVEVLAEGNKEQLDKLLAILRKGPPASWVSQVNFEWNETGGEFHTFQVLRTA